MKFAIGVSAVALVAAISFVGPAAATGETCKKPAVTAKGHEEHSEREARRSAIHAWEHAAEHKHGFAFSDWWYSADRSIPCTWDADGSHYTCTATALACGPSPRRR